MFDIGFSEVLLIFVIALVVLGPEKLPRVASQVGRWIGRARSMARQFREQLEEEVNLEQVRKAHEQKPKSQAQTDSGSGTSTGSADGAGSAAGNESTGGAAAGTASSASTASEGSAVETSPDAQHVGAEHGTQALGDTSSASAATYRGPDPADFRADTFSHAHPTNEYGANPYTATGAAEDPGHTPSEANVAAAQPQSESHAEGHEVPGEAYAPPQPRDNTPGTDNHGN
jgi:sec-independent protein translocase protein TatB